MGESSERLIEIIARPVDKRHETDIEGVIPWIRRRVQILHNVDKKNLIEIITLCKYQRIAKDDVIIEQGERGDCMFIILRGSALVYIDTSLTGEEESLLTTSATLSTRDDIAPAEIKRRNKLPERVSFGKYIMRYGPGNNFGEVALLSEDKSRNATVVAEEDCDLMVIGQELFDRILRAEQQIEYNEVCHFVKSHPYFAHMPAKFKRLLELSLRKETFPFDSIIARQGQPVTALHFLLEGQANMYVEPNAYQKQYPKLWPFEAGIDLYSQEFEYLRKSRKDAILRKYENPAALSIKSGHFVVKRTEGYAAAEKMVQERTVCLCTVHGGEVIGDLEIVQNLGTYLSTVICTAPTTAFVLDVRNLERLLGKRNPVTIDIMKQKAKEKLERRACSCLGRDITFLSYLLIKVTEGNFQFSVKKKLPPIKTSKQLPDKDVQIQHLLEKFKGGQAQLIEPRVPGALIYKEQMQEKARIRASFQRRGANAVSAKLREVQHKMAGRQPRSRREIVKFLKETMDSELAEYTRAYRNKNTCDTKHPKKASQKALMIDQADLEKSTIVDEVSKNVRFVDHIKQVLSNNEGRHNFDDNKLKNDEGTTCQETATRDVSPGTDNSNIVDFREDLHPQEKSNIFLTAVDDNFEEFSPTSPKMAMSEIVHSGSKNMDTGVEVTSNIDGMQNPVSPSSFKSENRRNDVPANVNSLSPLPCLAKSDLKQTENGSARKWQSAAMLVNNRIRERFSEQLLAHETGFDDYETSDKNLNMLENRIKTFFTKSDQSRKFTDKSDLIVPKLRRFKIQQEDPGVAQPKPGGRVWVRKTMCRYANTTLQVSDHEHIRYHMVPELPEFSNVQKTRIILHHMLSGTLAGNAPSSQS